MHHEVEVNTTALSEVLLFSAQNKLFLRLLKVLLSNHIRQGMKRHRHLCGQAVVTCCDFGVGVTVLWQPDSTLSPKP